MNSKAFSTSQRGLQRRNVAVISQRRQRVVSKPRASQLPENVTPESLAGSSTLKTSSCCGGESKALGNLTILDLPNTKTSAGGCCQSETSTSSSSGCCGGGGATASTSMLFGSDSVDSDGPGISRNDVQAAFNIIPRTTGGGVERVWDVQELLRGLPDDLVFTEDQDLDALMV